MKDHISGEQNVGEHTSQSKRQLADLTDSAFYRPTMYTPNGTIEEVGAFLEDYYTEASTWTPQQGPSRDLKRWHDFCLWLAKKIDSVESPSWSDVFAALRTSFPNNNDVFEKLQSWYREFLESNDALGQRSPVGT